MNLAVHGIDDTGLARGDTFVADLHAGVQMDYVMANPPFNIKDWARDEQDPRWCFGVPPAGNANFAWIQHILSKLGPRGKAGVGDDQWVDVVESCRRRRNSCPDRRRGPGVRAWSRCLHSCSVAPEFRCACGSSTNTRRTAAGQVLFIDARGLGYLVDRAERALTDEEIARIGDTYRAWLAKSAGYQDVPGFCKSATLDDIRAAGYVLTPGTVCRYCHGGG